MKAPCATFDVFFENISTTGFTEFEPDEILIRALLSPNRKLPSPKVQLSFLPNVKLLNNSLSLVALPKYTLSTPDKEKKPTIALLAKLATEEFTLFNFKTQLFEAFTVEITIGLAPWTTVL